MRYTFSFLILTSLFLLSSCGSSTQEKPLDPRPPSGASSGTVNVTHLDTGVNPPPFFNGSRN